MSKKKEKAVQSIRINGKSQGMSKNDFNIVPEAKVGVQYIKIQTITGKFVRETDNHLIFELWDNKYKKYYYKYIHKNEIRGLKEYHDGGDVHNMDD